MADDWVERDEMNVVCDGWRRHCWRACHDSYRTRLPVGGAVSIISRSVRWMNKIKIIILTFFYIWICFLFVFFIKLKVKSYNLSFVPNRHSRHGSNHLILVEMNINWVFCFVFLFYLLSHIFLLLTLYFFFYLKIFFYSLNIKMNSI